MSFPGFLFADPFAVPPSHAPLAQTPKPFPVPVRVRRVKIVGVSYPAIVLEATPGGARDVQELPGIKQVEPDPGDAHPDQCGSDMYTVIVSALFDWNTLVSAIEHLNDPDPVLDLLEQPSMYREANLLWLNALDRETAVAIGLDLTAHPSVFEGDMLAVQFISRTERDDWYNRIHAALWQLDGAVEAAR